MNNQQYSNHAANQWTFPNSSDDNLLQQQTYLQQQQAQLQQMQKEEQEKLQQQQQWMLYNAKSGIQRPQLVSDNSLSYYGSQNSAKKKDNCVLTFLKEYWMMFAIGIFVLVLFLYYACDMQQSVVSKLSPKKRCNPNMYDYVTMDMDEDIQSTFTEFSKTYLL